MSPDVHQLSRGLRLPALLLYFPPQEAAQEARKSRQCSSADQGFCECVSHAQLLSRRSSIDIAGSRGLYLARRSWDLRYTCHLSISPARSSTLDCPAAPPRLRIRSGGVNFLKIRPLQRFQSPQPLESFAAKVALLNCRSVSNKTFILNDFFIKRDLDMLFLTETWIGSGAGETSVFGELCPTNCSFISTPRRSGRGGGVALIFKNRLTVQTLSAETFSSFEVQCVKVETATTSLVCALVYRPPKSDKHFIKDFSDFLSHYATSYDCLLILGDFNIHVCFPGKPLVSEFCHVMESFGLLQHIQ